MLISDDDERAVEGRNGLVSPLLVLHWTLTLLTLGIENPSDVARSRDDDRMMLRLSVMMELSSELLIG